jgi:integrase
MGSQHIRQGVLTIRQQKTGETVSIPLHAEMHATLATMPRDRLTFLVTAQDRPFTPAGFTNWFRDMIAEAGLPAGKPRPDDNGPVLRGLSPHSLRKATNRRLAEAGRTPHEIMSITGHKTLAEVTRYTARVNRENLAKRAMTRMTEAEARTNPVKEV